MTEFSGYVVEVCKPIARPRIVFSTSNAWYSRLIRKCMGSAVSHVMLQFEVFEEPILLHADFGGVQFTPRARFEQHNTIVAEYELLNTIPKENIAVAIAHLNERYDYVGLLGYAWVLMLQRWFPNRRPVLNPLASSHAVVCSEFVARFDYHGAVVSTFKGMDPETTTPDDLLKALDIAVGKGQVMCLRGGKLRNGQFLGL
jgi:hypothetical protein